MKSKTQIKQDNYLKMIVESFIKYGLPIGSKNLITQNNLTVSSATVRNIMASLEKEGYLEKNHISGGRVPSIKGIKYYATELTTLTDDALTSKLKDIFSKRRVSIDETIEEASKTIANIAGLTVVTSDTDYSELLKSISLTQISDNQAVIILITSTGRVEVKKVMLNSNINAKDLSIAIRFMQERLIDTPINQLREKVLALTPIFKTQIKNAEELIVKFVKEIFHFVINNNRKIYGKSFIIEAEEINRNDLSKLINMIENESIWDSLKDRSLDGENLKIDIASNKTSVISKKIKVGNSTKEMSIIGTHRMDYSKAKNILNIIEKFLKE